MKAENEAALLNKCTEHETTLLKAALIKRKADAAEDLRLKFVKRKQDLKKKVIELKVKQSIVEENRMLNDVEVERWLAYVRAGLDPLYPTYLREYWIR